MLFIGDVRDKPSGRAALLPDHRYGAFGSLMIEIDNEDLGARPGEQDRRRAAIADAVIRRTAPRDDRDFSGEAEPVLPLRSVRHPQSFPKLTLTTQPCGLGPSFPEVREKSFSRAPLAGRGAG